MEFMDHGRTVAFRVPGHIWKQVERLVHERDTRPSVVLRELVTAGLAAQGDPEERDQKGDRQR